MNRFRWIVSVPLTMADFTGPFSIGHLHFSDPYYGMRRVSAVAWVVVSQKHTGSPCMLYSLAYVILFAMMVGPFCFMNISGTKWFQYCTMVRTILLSHVAIGL